MRWAIGLTMVVAASSWGCSDALPPEGQVLLHVTTDAPVPGSEVPALFERLRFDVIPPGADMPCPNCSREIAVDHAMLEGASVGIVPQSGTRVRVRLYRAAGLSGGEPRLGATIDSLVLLPEIGAEGIVDVHVHLATDAVGFPQGAPDKPLPAASGPGASGLTGSWAGAAVVPCSGEPRDDEACVPGGAFWMGDPLLDLNTSDDLDGQHQRLVSLSPFFIDTDEVTVAEFRASGLAVSLLPDGPSDNPHEAGGNIDFCTYTSEPSENDALPVNCLSWTKAAEYCAFVGKTLPTEAQLELLMSRRGAFPYVWGVDAPTCPDAIVQRDDECSDFGFGVAVAGSGARDRLPAAGREVVDLIGNVKEWAADRWNRELEPCWGYGVFYDPQCELDSPSDGKARSIRGGDWTADALDARAAVRHRLHNEEQAVSATVGFRCARPDG